MSKIPSPDSLPRPLCLLTYGLAGSGKSTLARALAKVLGCEVLRSDVIHRQLQGIAPGERAETGFLSGAYTLEAKKRTYVELLKMTTEMIDQGQSVIVDASMGYPYMRDPFFGRVLERGWAHALIRVQVGEEESKRRLDARAAEGKDASDATYDIYCRQKDAFVPPEEVEQIIDIDGEEPLEAQVQAVLRGLGAFYPPAA